MNLEREKREREIEKLTQGSDPNPEAEVQFKEELKRTASAIFEQETRKIQKTERPPRRKRPLDAASIGLWLIVLGIAGFVFDVPQFGAIAVIAGIAAIGWGILLKSSGHAPRSTASRRGPRRRPF